MAAHYGKERNKYGTLTGSVITWPVPYNSPQEPNSPEAVAALPAGYLRCDGSKYKAGDYPSLAEICGTGERCKFAKFDENGEIIGTIGEDEFVVPDLGSKYPRPSPSDSGVFNNIIEETVNGTFIKRSGIGIEASSNVGTVADVLYTGNFIVPSQTIPLRGKPSWQWGNDGMTDVEIRVDWIANNTIKPCVTCSRLNFECLGSHLIRLFTWRNAGVSSATL